MVRIAALLGALILGWTAQGSCVTIIPPGKNLVRPEYDYSNVTCTSCHFIDGYDHTARAAGLQFNSATNMWERTGHGWWDSRHAQSQYGWSSTATNYGWVQPPGPYGETDNTFCAFCHSPLQAAATEPGMFLDGSVIDPVTVSSFQGVTCSSCHPSNTIAAEILTMYPTAISGGETATLIRGSNPSLATSWIPILPGQESKFCLNCHEVNPHSTPENTNAIFQVMFDAGVTCLDCHMAPYIVGVAGNTTGTPVGLTERFHDWKVAENLPYSCGAQGSLNQFTCHAEFTADSARAFIPLMTAQHSDWWSLPPFSTGTLMVSAHELNGTSDQLALWREIQAVYGPASHRQTNHKEISDEGGARLKTVAATR
ncbi:MAG: hypothetical protein WCA22_19450 [Candidatus Binatus sp.]